MRNLINLAGRLVRGPDDCEPQPLRCEAAGALKDAHYEIERLHGIVEAIDALRREEGDSIEIVCDNPVFGDLDSTNVVKAYGNWCGHDGRSFYGKSLIDALARAVKAREAAEAAKGK